MVCFLIVARRELWHSLIGCLNDGTFYMYKAIFVKKLICLPSATCRKKIIVKRKVMAIEKLIIKDLLTSTEGVKNELRTFPNPCLDSSSFIVS